MNVISYIHDLTQVIQEYLTPLPQLLDGLDLSMHMPNFQAVCSIIEERLHYNFNQTMSYLVPATIKMAFHGVLPDLEITPLRCVHVCVYTIINIYNTRPGYQIAVV